MALSVLKIPERGVKDVNKDVWNAIADPNFWRLVERGVVSVEQRPNGIVRLKASCYVGRAIIGNQTVLEIEEKIPGSLVTLMAHAARTNFRLHSVPSPTSPLGPLIELLAQQYVEAVNRYASRGRDFTYKRISQMGSLIGGKLDVTGTVRLHSRGLRHLARFERNTILFDTPVNCVILAALRELERINHLIPIDDRIIAKSRALAVLFSDCRSQNVLFGTRASLIHIASSEQERTTNPLIGELMSLAGVILSHESFEHTGGAPDIVPRSWFLNLETLFETAVRNLMTATLSKRALVQNGRTAGTSIFALNPFAYKAHPDLVIRHSDDTCVVGDAKFKDPPSTAAPSDLYQLLVHASAFGARTAFLVYPGDSFQVHDQGIAATSARVYLFSVSLSTFRQSIESLASVIQPPPSLSVSTAAPPTVAESERIEN